jgi:general secretion pathway protein D
VGDQVPIATEQSVGTQTTNAPIVNSIQYRDTGVILKVTPRVNANGIVNLDISQEVSNVTATTSSTLTSPTIQQRKFSSILSVQGGETIALGGMIQDNRENGNNGIPTLKYIPIVGSLFGTKNNQMTRTEVLVLITPHVIRSNADIRKATEILRRQLTFPPSLPKYQHIQTQE